MFVAFVEKKYYLCTQFLFKKIIINHTFIMKKILTFFSLLALVFSVSMTSCDGPDSPDGNKKPKPDVDTPSTTGVFDIEVTNIKESSFDVTITSSKPELGFICYYITVDEFKKRGDDKTNVDVYMNELRQTAQMNGWEFSELLAQVTLKGSYGGTHACDPGVEYYVCVFGVDDKGGMTTELEKKQFKSKEVVETETTFDIKVVEGEGGVTVTVTPSDENTYYFADLQQAGFINGDPYNGDVDLYFDIFRQYLIGNNKTPDEMIAEFGHQGVYERTFEKLQGGGYVYYVVPVSDSFYAIGKATKKEFTVK